MEDVFFAGLAAALVAGLNLGARQLHEHRPSPSSALLLMETDAGRQKAEAMLPLDSLGTLAQGVNYDLRTAALRILTRRAVGDRLFLAELTQDDRERRVRALRATGWIAQQGEKTGRPLVEALVESLGVCEEDGGAGLELGIDVLGRLMHRAEVRDWAVAHGVAAWLAQHLRTRPQTAGPWQEALLSIYADIRSSEAGQQASEQAGLPSSALAQTAREHLYDL